MNARKRAGVAIATLGLVASAGLSAPAEAATRVTEIKADLTTVTLLNFNDFHGRIDDGMQLTGVLGQNFACNIVTARTTHGADNTLLLSTGDIVGASSFASNLAEDFPTIEYLNALGLQSSAVGNHEFDRGFGWLTGEAQKLAEFTYLGANVYKRGTTEAALPEYKIHEVNGVKVGVIGAVTADTPNMVTPAGVSGLDFGDPVTAVNRVAAQLKDGDAANGEADIVVAQYHEGASTTTGLTEAKAASPVFKKLAEETDKKVDVIFNGHTHLAYQWDTDAAEGTRVISQSGSYGGALGVIQLGYDKETGKVEQYIASNVATAAATDACKADATWKAAAAIVDEAVADAKEKGLVPVAKISADITTAYGDAAVVDGAYTGTKRDNRLRESSLGNLAANAWLWALNQPGRPGADIGIMNPGGLRAELIHKQSGTEGDGVVTYAEAAAINPFANTLQTVDVTGAVFKKVLEQQWQPEGASRPFLKLGLSDNVRYTYDPDAAAGSRILQVWIDGEPLDPAATYTVTAGNFLIGGGDNFTALAEGTNSADTGMIDTDAFVNYLASEDVMDPSFEKNGVAITDGPATVARNTDQTIVIEGVDLTSLGAPANTEFEVVVGETVIGTAAIETKHVEGVPTRDGVATVKLNVNSFVIGDTVQLVAKESGTVVTLPLAGLTVKSFRDVPPGNQFYKEITWAGSSGLATGWDDGTYRPYDPINRDAMAAFIYRLAGSPSYDVPKVSPFKDVATDNLFYREIAWLHETGISTGWDDGTFRPYDSINRDAMAAFLYRLAGKPQWTAPATSPFVDMTARTQFYAEVTWLAEVGITTGWDDNTFRPVTPVNRDAMAAFLYRYVNELGVPQV